MAFLDSRETDTEEKLDELTAQAAQALVKGESDKAEYESRILQLEARRALLLVAPAMDANADAQLKDLDYLHSKGWITDEEYQARRKEITGA